MKKMHFNQDGDLERDFVIPTICCRHCGNTEIEPLDPWVWWCNPCRWFVRL